MDADVISIEASKSDLKLLQVFKAQGYENDVGPGLYEWVPFPWARILLVRTLILSLLALPASTLLVSPASRSSRSESRTCSSPSRSSDSLSTLVRCLCFVLLAGWFTQLMCLYTLSPAADCGLKTRGWKETEESLQNLVNAAKVGLIPAAGAQRPHSRLCC